MWGLWVSKKKNKKKQIPSIKRRRIERIFQKYKLAAAIISAVIMNKSFVLYHH
jgi:alpha-L-arabinofuranosidase